MRGFERYNIQVGQMYKRADGAKGTLEVKDVETYADVDDVVVFCSVTESERRIDCFKLARVRYCLVR